MNPASSLSSKDGKSAESNQGQRTPKILYVDDEPLSLKSFRKILSRDFEIFTAGSAQEALKILEEHSNDIGILVADQRMPKTTGVELIRRARERWPHIVALLATAYMDFDAAINAINEGRVFKYIRKPWDPDLLKSELLEASQEYRLNKLNAKLADANRELAQIGQNRENFIRMLSHEVRTPINISVNLADYLLGTPLNDEQREHLSSVKELNDQLSNLLDNSLDYSKWSAGKLKLLKTDFQLDSVFSSLSRFFDFQTEKKEIEFTLSIDPDVTLGLRGDPDRLLQVLVNLVGNAVKFTPKGGSISVDVELVEKTDDKIKLSFSVKDTGIGISPSGIKKLFKSHSQVQTTVKGAGLGLCISKELIALMDGEIEVRSELGKGAEFCFDAVFEIQTPKPIRPSATSFSPSSQCVSILVADDERINRKLVATILSKHGCKVDEATDGLEAVALASKNDYSAIILDCQMPGLNGFEASDKIRESTINKETPIIALTATSKNDIADKVSKANFTDFVTKPFCPKRLIETVENWTQINLTAIPQMG